MSEDAARLQQLCGRALLFRAPRRHQHHDPVCARNGTHPVGDDEDGFVFDETGECLLNGCFVFHIQAGGGFVQQNDGRVLQKRTGDGNALTLAAGKLAAVLTDVGVPAVGKLSANLSTLASFCRRDYLFVRRVLCGRCGYSLSKIVLSNSVTSWNTME